MIGTVLRIGWINLKRDRAAQGLTFVLPIVFFSIFALILGNQGRRPTARIRIALANEDDSDFSRRVSQALQAQPALRVRTSVKVGDRETPIDRGRAEAMVRRGDVTAAVILPSGLGEAVSRAEAEGPTIRLLSDASDPIAGPVLQGLVQKAVMEAAPDLMVKRGLAQLERYAGALTAAQRSAIDRWRPAPAAPGASGRGPDERIERSAFGIGIESAAVFGNQANSPIAFYAAGIGVMFLLFSCAGAGGSLLEEVESGTLERLLSCRLTMRGLLAGKWLFLTLMGVAQTAIMFTWGALVFDLELRKHIPGFLVMTVVTAGAAGAFGLTLAAASRSRAQLSAISTILILTMSALGGSMFPRFLMGETMQRIGLVTFNAWALDGYLKVFWRNAALWELWPQLLVLALLTALFLGSARLLARRWETI